MLCRSITMLGYAYCNEDASTSIHSIYDRGGTVLVWTINTDNIIVL